jgi:hypothetical protein
MGVVIPIPLDRVIYETARPEFIQGTVIHGAVRSNWYEDQAVEAMTINNKQVSGWGTSTWAIFPKALQR